ncbi:MAG: T9SS type A sorting domain-containing protein [Bacteroidia bacterium]|nr:T9SS type A sorting domain-containing protein [Bacteroidia bacterium]
MKIIGLIILTLFYITAKGQGVFQKTFGTINYEEIWGLDITSDNGFILAGYTNIDNGYILKLNSNGDTIWTKNIDAGGMDLLYSIQQTQDNGFIVGGRTSGFGGGGLDMFLIKIDSNGNNQWTKAIGGPGDETINSVKETSDGGFIIAGNTYSFGAGLNDFYIVKMDSSGNILWSKSIGGTGNDNAYSITQTIDSGYVAVGLTASTGAGDKDVLSVKLDKNGNIVWTKTYGGTGDDRANSIQQTIDGGFIISGVTNSFGAGNYDFYLIKTDLSGNLSWEKTFGGVGDDWAYSIEQTKDNGFILAGYTASFGKGDKDYYLVKSNSVGDTIWTRTFGGPMAEIGTLAKQTSDNGYAIIGYGQSFGAGSCDFYFVKTDSNGNGICNQNNTNTLISNPTSTVTIPSLTVSSGGIGNSISPVITSGTIINSLCTNVGMLLPEQLILDFNFYPNPAQQFFNIELPQQQNFNLLVYDITGRKVVERTNATGTVKVDCSSLTSGIYFVRAVNEKNILSCKLIKE